MSSIIDTLCLKKQLDNIDSEIYDRVHDGYKESRLRVLVGLWEKGEVIDGVFRGVKTPPSYRELERQTGRTHESLKSWRDLYRKYPDQQKYVTEIAEPKAEEWTKKALAQKWTPLLESGSPEWWTPAKYIEAVWKVMGQIDLDPASCEAANETVRATKYFGLKDDGLKFPWKGKVFLNPPYGAAGPAFVNKMIEELRNENITEAILLVNSRATDAEWFQPLFDGVLCFTDHRIDFDMPGLEGKKNLSTHGSCFVYFGPRPEKFATVFAAFGNVVRRY